MMNDRNQQGGERLHDDKGRGPQGIDKAPGEETPQNIENFVAETQKGKNQVDGDLDRPEDQPIEHQDIE